MFTILFNSADHSDPFHPGALGMKTRHAYPRSTFPKVCAGCGEMKAAEDFPTNKRRVDGLDARCKPCCAAATRAWREANPVSARAAETRWREKNPDVVRDIRHRGSQKYIAKDPEAWRERSRVWKAKNREWCRRKSAEHAKTNPVMYAVKAAHRRAQTKNATPPWLTAAQKKETAAFFAEARRMTSETGVQHCVDHIVPLQSPIVCGLHVPWNLRVITKSENVRKWSHLIEDLVLT